MLNKNIYNYLKLNFKKYTIKIIKVKYKTFNKYSIINLIIVNFKFFQFLSILNLNIKLNLSKTFT